MAADPLNRPTIQITFEVLIAVILCTTSILGNIMVILAVRRNQTLRSVTTILIENLAFVDIINSIIVVPSWISSLRHGQWLYSGSLCQFEAFTLFTLAMTSAFIMVLIAVQRYLKVVKPVLHAKYFSSYRSARIYCIVAFLLSIIISFPPLIGWGRFAYHKLFCFCSLVWEMKQISYVILVCNILNSSLNAIISICYYKVYKAVRAASQNVANHVNQGALQNSTLNTIASRTDKKLLRSTVLVFVVFVLCWTPLALVCLSEALGASPNRFVYLACSYLMFFNTCSNPVIYGLCNPQFKDAFQMLIKRGGQAQGISGCSAVQDRSAEAVHSCKVTTSQISIQQ